MTRVHPLAIRVLQEQGIDTDALYSKSLTDFLGQRFDVVITVCDRANESCPIFPGDPERIHWSIPDPSAVARDGGGTPDGISQRRACTSKRRLPLFIDGAAERARPARHDNPLKDEEYGNEDR